MYYKHLHWVVVISYFPRIEDHINAISKHRVYCGNSLQFVQSGLIPDCTIATYLFIFQCNDRIVLGSALGEADGTLVDEE